MRGKVYVPHHEGGAGLWIYRGYAAAWDAAGFDVEYYTAPTDVNSIVNGSDIPEKYFVMATEGSLNYTDPDTYKFLSNSEHTWMFVQPTEFPSPWGTHPNFVSKATDEFITEVNSMDNVTLWSFANTSETNFWHRWKTVNYVPLAFDHINYPVTGLGPGGTGFPEVVYVGGLANNGFNEKARIMDEYFLEISKRGINMDGIFINQQIPHGDELQILHYSKICLNIHDKYQQELELDCNERTFKSLGLGGFLISDKVRVLDDILESGIPQAGSAKEMADLVEEYLSMDLRELKNANRAEIYKNHTYSHRVNTFLNDVYED